MNPIARILQHQSTLVLDGGLATELERRGFNIDDPLWSARILLEAPEAIRQLHLDYLLAGADVLITASYQASFPGFEARGYSPEQAASLLKLSVELAVQARDIFWREPANRAGRQRPLIAASIGPYGAFLANGAEYTGDYNLDQAGLQDWHRKRWQTLADTEADLLACETIPSWPEMLALVDLLEETPERWAWFTFSCRDGAHISDGTPLARCAAFLNDYAKVAGVGINCTPPRFLPALIQAVQDSSQKPIIVYPNSGERYDAATNRWFGQTHAEEFGTAAREWRKGGAAAIGGCCRTSPAHIRAVSERLKRSTGSPTAA